LPVVEGVLQRLDVAKAVLEREHVRPRAHERAHVAEGLLRVVRLDGEDEELRHVGLLRARGGARTREELGLPRDAEALRGDDGRVLGPRDERHVVPRGGERGADPRADGASAEDDDLQRARSRRALRMKVLRARERTSASEGRPQERT